uniref:Death domain-containing protein n=1 Tax=Amphimedon queenslandica TaxID=400682 RepID=A0A1X7UWN0_AMPQE
MIYFCSLVGVDELVDVIDLLKKCGFPETKWHELGLRLGLRKNTLDAIEMKYRGDVYRCTTECLSQWLSRADNVDIRGGANLDSLSDTLRSMNETAVAEKLQHHVLINIFNNRHTVLSQSLCDSVGIAWLLYAEHMLTQEAVSRVVSARPSIPNQREALLTAVKEAVQTDPNSLHTFANVLCSISTNIQLGQAILDDISKYFPTPEVCLTPETLKDHDIVSQDNASTNETTKIPTITQSGNTNTEGTSNSSSVPLSSQVEVPVPKHLFVEFSSIRISYTRMLYNACKILKRNLNVDDIKEFLSCYSSLSKKVEQCSDVSSILRHVKDECSLTNITLLHSIVEEMNITEAEEHIEAYKVELNKFYKSISISLCLEKRFDSVSHLQCEIATFIFDWEPEEHMLKDIKDILSKVSGKLLIIKYIESSTSISVTCSFPFSDIGFTVLRMMENIHILMGQGLKKLTIGNLTLWRRQDVRQKELKEKDQDLMQQTEVISYILFNEAEYRLRDSICSKEKEIIELQQELSILEGLTIPKKESLSVSSKKVEQEPLDEEFTVLCSQFNELKEENKKLSDKLSKMKIDYLRSLSSNSSSAVSKVRRGMAFEIDDCKFHLEAMTIPDYQPLVDNKKVIEQLQERITLMNMELIIERECSEKIIKGLKEVEDKRQKQKMEGEMCKVRIELYCNHPVTGESMSTFKVHKDELLPVVLDKAYKLMKLAPHIPIERCRLVKYNYWNNVMHRSFDLDQFQHQTIEQLIGRARVLRSFELFLETRKKDETFRKYNDGGVNLKMSVVDLSTGEVAPAKPVRGERGWAVEELKQYIGELFNINSSCMRLVMEMDHFQGVTESDAFIELRDKESTLGTILYEGNKK